MTPTDMTPDELQARKDAADSAKAEADAALAVANARKAEAEVTDHDAALAQQSRDATSRKEIAAADKEAADSRVGQLKALIPDFGAVKDSPLEVKDGPPLFGSVLTFGALRQVAESISDKIHKSRPSTSTGWRVLVTSDPDLASSDSVYRDVTTGLDQLDEAAAKLLKVTDPDQVEPAGFVPPLDVAAALASALPGVLSLLSAHRALTTAAVTVNDLAAAAEVAGALKANPAGGTMTVVHDDFQLAPGGGVYAASSIVSTKRQELVGRKLVITEKESGLDSELAEAMAEKKTLEDKIAKAGKKAPPNLGIQLGDLLKKIELLNRHITRDVVRLGLIDSLITSIDTYTAAIRVVPAGARRSPLATAALHELLHKPGPTTEPAEQFSHVLLIKGQQGSSQQLIKNLPLWWEDKFSTMVDVSVTYMLIEVPTSHLVASGTVTGVANAWGKIGEKATFELEEPT